MTISVGGLNNAKSGMQFDGTSKPVGVSIENTKDICARLADGSFDKAQAMRILSDLVRSESTGKQGMQAGRILSWIVVEIASNDQLRDVVYAYCRDRYFEENLEDLTDFEIWGLMNPSFDEDFTESELIFDDLKRVPRRLDRVIERFDLEGNRALRQLKRGFGPFDTNVSNLLSGRLPLKSGVSLYQAVLGMKETGTEIQKLWADRFLEEFDRRVESAIYGMHLAEIAMTAIGEFRIEKLLKEDVGIVVRNEDFKGEPDIADDEIGEAPRPECSLTSPDDEGGEDMGLSPLWEQPMDGPVDGFGEGNDTLPGLPNLSSPEVSKVDGNDPNDEKAEYLVHGGDSGDIGQVPFSNVGKFLEIKEIDYKKEDQFMREGNLTEYFFGGLFQGLGPDEYSDSKEFNYPIKIEYI